MGVGAFKIHQEASETRVLSTTSLLLLALFLITSSYGLNLTKLLLGHDLPLVTLRLDLELPLFLLYLLKGLLDGHPIDELQFLAESHDHVFSDVNAFQRPVSFVILSEGIA